MLSPSTLDRRSPSDAIYLPAADSPRAERNRRTPDAPKSRLTPASPVWWDAAMNAGTHPESGLTKSTWSDADFEAMGWHDVTVHGICVQPSASPDNPLPRLLLDLDYIVRWVHPVEPAQNFTFWIAPSTLVFEDVWDIEGDLDFKGMALRLEIDHLHRSAPEGSHGGPVRRT
ncbi:hypothetical protein, partial [Kitasatospora sp. NPDC093558]|uniref:hypothetical protein n=1 Tax=Kitasatospora sp. NPDC093558 TaxID=3155201 RepID=UPI00341F467F